MSGQSSGNADGDDSRSGGSDDCGDTIGRNDSIFDEGGGGEIGSDRNEEEWQGTSVDIEGMNGSVALHRKGLRLKLFPLLIGFARLKCA